MKLILWILVPIVCMMDLVYSRTDCQWGQYLIGERCLPCFPHVKYRIWHNLNTCRYLCDSGHPIRECTATCSFFCFKDECHHLSQTCLVGCSKGWYGNLCNSPCSPGCKDDECDFYGRCTCKSGYFGKQCNKNCKEYCKNDSCVCSFKCPQNCLNSNCNDDKCVGCKPGYRGLNCNQSCEGYCSICHQFANRTCMACKPGKYGSECNKSCSPGCTDMGCQIDNGTCLECRNSMFGVRCDYICSAGCRGGVCDQITGECSIGCNNTSYGAYCNHTCSKSCSHSHCHIVSSGDVKCSRGCEDGWWGPYCQQKCPQNCQACVSSLVCVLCKGSKYGYNCSQTCSNGCVGQDCDMSGVCRQGCKLGWMGKRCQVSSLWFILCGCVAVIFIVCVMGLWKRGWVRSCYHHPRPYSHDQDRATPNDSRLCDHVSSGGNNLSLETEDHGYETIHEMDVIELEETASPGEDADYQLLRIGSDGHVYATVTPKRRRVCVVS